jgi:lipopolysaccharide export system protein LptA
MRRRVLMALPPLGLILPLAARAQAPAPAPAGSRLPVEITASDGIEWRRAEQMVIARGDARAVRDGTVVTADRLIGRYRARAPAAGSAPRPAAPGVFGTEQGSNEIFRLEALGRVVIARGPDRAQGDRAIYDLDQAVMLLTGQNLMLTTRDAVVTARDALEYWPDRRLAVARGNAAVDMREQRRKLFADTLSAFFAQGAVPGADGGTGRLERMEAFGNVRIETEAEVVQGDVGVYAPDSGIARLGGNVRITRGQNQLVGQQAEVNMRTGVSRLIGGAGSRVQGLIVPNAPGGLPSDPTAPAPARP